MKNKYKIILLLIIIGLSCISIISSPFYKGTMYNDPSVFQIMGKGMLQNQIMYKDLFDHKGPIIYIINALAYLISPHIGLFIIEIVFIYIGTIYIYKTSNLILKKGSFLISLLYLMLIFRYIDGGNLTEEYAITFMSIAQYYILKILYEKETNIKKSWIIIGATFTINFFIKPTYISIWIAFGITQLIYYIKDNKIKELIKCISYIFIGVAIVLVPIIIYLLKNDAIKDFINAYFIMNMKYSEASIIKKITCFIDMIKIYGYEIFIIFAVLSNIVVIFNKKQTKIKLFITLYFIISLILTAWAPKTYIHYLIQLAPCITLELTFLICNILSLMEKTRVKKYKEQLPLKLIYICIAISILFSSVQINNFLINSKKGDTKRSAMDEIKTYINQEDKILVLGNQPYYYIYLDKQPEFKYFFQMPIIMYDRAIAEETQKYVYDKKPKIIIDTINIYNKNAQILYGMKLIEIIEGNYEKHENGVITYYVLKDNIINSR